MAKPKLSQDQIKRIKELREQGKILREISKELNVAQSTVAYWCGYKDYYRNKRRERYHSLTKEQKRELFEKQKVYQREYRKKRYHEDEDFREKLKKRAREWNRRK